MSGFVTRFAPSPTGFLHLGHALSAMTAFRAAQSAGGRFLLRIEDVDQTRCRAQFEAAILEDLAWLGIAWEHPFRRQSEHFDTYRAALQGLQARGLLYSDERSRRERAEGIRGSPGAGTGPETGRAVALRLSVARARASLSSRPETRPEGMGFVEERRRGDGFETVFHRADPGLLGDAVLARKDSPASYHLAVVCDDALQGVTHVIRGEDLRDATHLHCLLQALLGLPTPVYRFHPLIPDAATGRKLSKRDGATALRDLRAAGAVLADILAQIAEYSA